MFHIFKCSHWIRYFVSVFHYWKSTCVKIQDFFGVLNFFRFFYFLFSPRYFDSISFTAFNLKTNFWLCVFTGSPTVKPSSLASSIPNLLYFVLILLSSVLVSQHVDGVIKWALPLTALQRHNIRKFETNIPTKGIVRPQSWFPHTCVCERFIYSHDQSAYSGKYVDRSWEYINCSQTHECGNWGLRPRNSQKRNT